MGTTAILTLNLAVIALAMITLWLISLLMKDASIADIFWGLGFVMIAWVTFFAVEARSNRKWLIAILVTIWGVRLAGYLAKRNLGKGEDYRYRAMREKYGSKFPIASLFIVFGLQGAIMWVAALPIQIGQMSEAMLFWLDFVGVAVWGAGMLFESVGDFQLARFKQDPSNEGKVMDRGLWRYTRHPNYFGEFLICWGFFLLALAGGLAWWTAIGPLLMTFLLMKVSGVAMLEESLKRRRAGYDDYIRRTSTFFPWPPRPADSD